MSPDDRFERARGVFERAVDLPAGERAAFLERECAGDPALRADVAGLLASHDSAPSNFLGKAAHETLQEQIPAQVGPYHVLRRLGEGGMGTVYLAEQREPIRREVAVKVIRAGLDTRQVVERFQSERQALAMMDHPAIARVFDAGATDDGRPYFAMEFIDGPTLIAYCDNERLTVAGRIRLFVQVCDGVHYAHQKGIIHRDIKPGNILVARVNGRAVPKIIDFGIVKGPKLTAETLVTHHGDVIGTPEYMSPEQADQRAVDTRTDVYSLGVILYELLSGALPFSAPSWTRCRPWRNRRGNSCMAGGDSVQSIGGQLYTMYTMHTGNAPDSRKVHDMRMRNIVVLMLPVLLCGCAASVDVESMLRDFDDYEEDVRAVTTDAQAIETLDGGQQKRAEAGTLVEEGKKKDAVPVVERAMADARLALEMSRMKTSSRRAEKCLVEVEQARTKWREAVFVLEQTEEFTGARAVTTPHVPEPEEQAPELPATTLEPDSFPPATMDEVSSQWAAWRGAADDYRVAAAEIENDFHNSRAAAAQPKAAGAVAAHHRYLAARAVQSLECRVRADANERVCVDAARLTAGFGDARADALRATLDLERGLQENLRYELTQLREEAKSRQDELYEALSQMEGKFASIRRDARGTIVSLADILFDFDKATLRRDVEFNLVKIATILNQFGEMGILIEGHTDSIGTEEYNLGLSQRRAKAVHEFLVSQGVKEARLSWEGYGESRPVADNDTDEGRQQNRRVDLVIQDAP